MCNKGKYYSIKNDLTKSDHEMMCEMTEDGSNVYDIKPTGKEDLVFVGDATKEETQMMERLILKGKKILRVEGVPANPCGGPGQPKCPPKDD